MKIRFRIGTDQGVGDAGWEIDNITFNNITNTPFSTIDPQPPSYFDEFASDSLDASWLVEKQGWSENNGELIGIPTGKKAQIVETAFSCGSNCTIQTTMETGGGIGNKAWLFGWRADKSNTVELLMKEENNKWLLRQRVNGSILAKESKPLPIDPMVSYDVRLTFDGNVFQLFIDGALAITIPKAPGTNPGGFAGFAVKNTTLKSQRMCIQ